MEELEGRVLLASTRFAVIGDFGMNNPEEGRVAAVVRSWRPEYVITTGDNNYPVGDQASIDTNIGKYYQEFIGNYQGTYGAGSATNRFFPSLGNHDWYTAGAAPYLNYFTLPGNERYYEFVRGPVHFFAIDSDPNEPDGRTSTSVQGTWLKNALAASTSPWNVVYFHHPPYSSSSVHGNETVMQWPFKQWGADVVINGHDHEYERINHPTEGLFIVNGAGGAGLYGYGTPVPGSAVRYNARWGAMRVEATDTAITYLFVNDLGEETDRYTVSAAAGVPSAPAGVTATAVSPRQVDLAWTDVSSSESGYRIERSTGGSNFYAVTTVGRNVTRYSDLDLVPGTAYAYRVRAVNEAGASAVPAAPASATTPATPAGSGARALVPVNATWKFLDTGAAPAAGWTGPGFDETGWKSGAGELGYGDGDEGTVVSYGPSASNKYITTYFRHTFDLADPASVTALQLRAVRDDGIVVYLNGVEVMRDNMPGGAIGNTTLAASNVNGSGKATYYTVPVNRTLLGATNTIAVEVHQSGAASDDLSFNLELLDLGAVPGVPLLWTAGASDSQVDLMWGEVAGATGYEVERSADGVVFDPIATLPAGSTGVAATGLSPSTFYAFRVRAAGAWGTSGYSATMTAVTLPAGPTADVVDVTPDPRAAAVESISLVFNRAVSGFDLSDLALARDGVPVGLAGAALGTADGGATWTLSGLAALTAAAGRYTLVLAEQGTGVVDGSGNPLSGGAGEAWVMTPAPGEAPPKPDLAAGSDSGVSDTDDITAATSLTFTGTAAPGALVRLYLDGVEAGSGTAAGGTYTITVADVAAGARAVTARVDAWGTQSAASPALAVLVDRAGPKVAQVRYNGGAAATAVRSVSLAFDEPTTVGTTHLYLYNTTTGQAVPFAAMALWYSMTTATAVWTFPGLPRGLPPDGNYAGSVTPLVTDLAGNALDGNGDGAAGEPFGFTFYQLVGDLNMDRKVDSADVRLLYAQMGTASASGGADLDGDGVVGFGDLQMQEVAVGRAVPAAGALAASSPAPAPPPVVAPTAPVAAGASELLAADTGRRVGTAGAGASAAGGAGGGDKRPLLITRPAPVPRLAPLRAAPRHPVFAVRRVGARG